MKYSKNIIFISLLFFCISCHKEPKVPRLHDGDIIFQVSQSAQSQAIQLATHSKYSHCGIVYKDTKGKFYVFEAVQPVKKTPLLTWIARGADDDFVVKRLKDTTALTPVALAKMKKAGNTMYGKDYDLYFEWNNNRMYCSELVWKLYKDGTGLELGHLQHLKDFDLANPVVQQKMKQRYGNNIPMDEKVISPSDIFDSKLLTTVIAE